MNTPAGSSGISARRVAILAAIGLAGVAASILLASSLRSREHMLFLSEFERRASERARAIERELRSNLEHVEAIADLFVAAGEVDRSQFRAFTASTLETHSSIRGLGFNPILSDGERDAHELATRLEGYPDYHVTERNASGRLIPAARRESYVVASFLEPFEGNEKALGYDIASEPVRRAALLRARDTAAAAVSGGLRLVQEPGDQYGVLLVVPVYRGPAPSELELRRQRIRGYAIGVLRIGDMVQAALGGFRPGGIHLGVFDMSESEGPRLLHFHRSRTESGDDDDLDEWVASAEVDATHAFDFAGRRWAVRATPTLDFLASADSLVPAGALGTGLLITTLLVGYLAWQGRVNERLRRAFHERERAEQQQVALGRMLDEAHNEIYVFDAGNLRFVHVNRGARQNSGYAIDELRRMTPLDLKPEMTAESFDVLLRPLRDNERPSVHFTTVHRRKNGSLYDVEVHLQLSTYDSAPAFVAVIVDISERKRLEEQIRRSQRLEALGTLAGGIAHDFNNLLTSIMGYSELCILDLPADSPNRRRIGEVIRASERAKGIVRQILTFSRRRPIERRQIDLHELVREALQLVRVSLPSTISIREHLPGRCRVLGDPTQIHQVLMNLCTNAAHAMRGRDGILEVHLEAQTIDASATTPGSYAKLSVVDNGHGIAPEVVGRIFDPFFTTKAQDEGTGMGLAVAHSIVKSHGGWIDVKSEVGHGTRFDVYLPRVTAAANEEEAQTDCPRGEAAGETVMVVDDEPTIAELIRAILEKSGHKVEAYTDSTEALEAFRRRCDRYDVVVTDFTMPKMNGARLAEELRSLVPDIPVILVSGYGEMIDEEEIAASGIRTVLTKPLRFQELTAAVRRMLDESPDET